MEFFGLQNTYFSTFSSIEQESCGENPVVLLVGIPVEIHLDAALLYDLIMHIQGVTLSGLRQIAGGKLPEGMGLVEGA